ncbi:uncharacterized protein MONBRDRAFT_29515 [Monosiga brevicollis MX1]|uniref:Uncharacterized protein n=1 Tax=Monosiga brevicollis TaxID=81824 RepID=A9VBB2_MONBE|nr:uncharacterized protein MONBRDRAFT_29515 [Monosiga brevicollis MX1]EDQ85206.1 predicted protein [Monosiga brevicollis MX1]|eukprot:XP_001750031.1 hypothetical protein [Monosiga brevicollis MX1]
MAGSIGMALAAAVLLACAVVTAASPRFTINDVTYKTGDYVAEAKELLDTHTNQSAIIITNMGGRVEAIRLVDPATNQLRDVIATHDGNATAMITNPHWQGEILLPYANRIRDASRSPLPHPTPPSLGSRQVDDRLDPTGTMTAFHGMDGSAPIGGDPDAPTYLDDEFKARTPCDQYSHVVVDGNTHIQLFADASYPYVQIYTGAVSTWGLQAIALEAMSAEMDAYNNYNGLHILDAGEVFESSFGVALL